MKDPKSYRSNGIGASVKRLEDDRYLSGRGKFVGDIRLPGMLEIAFVRSPLAHANIKNIHKPEGVEESVFICEDLISVSGITEKEISVNTGRLLNVSDGISKIRLNLLEKI